MIFKINNRLKVFLSICLIMTLLFGYLDTAISSSYFENIASETHDEAQFVVEKIAPELKQAMENNQDFFDVLVYLKDRVDIEKDLNLDYKGKTPYESKILTRNSLVSALRNKSRETQGNLLEFLAQENEKRNVIDYESFYIVNMVYVKATKDVIGKIANMNEVEKIYLDSKLEVPKPILDKNFLNSSNLDGIEWNIKQIEADKVWDLDIDGSGIVVGIIDTGVDWTHEALRDKWRGYDPATGLVNPEGNWYDAVFGQSMPYDIEDIPHGSHCLGTILGEDPSGNNRIGVAPGAKWIAAKAFIAEGGQDSWLLRAGQWMFAPGGDVNKAPDIINNSWGGGPGINDWYRDVVTAWRKAGIVPIFAAGNQRPGEPLPMPGSITVPSNYPESIAVAATNKDNIRGSFSKLGPSPYDESLIKPEVSAPGVSIRSSIPGGYEGGWSGTSMAAPHISGVAALLLSTDYSLTVDNVLEIIQTTATPLTDESYSSSPNFGYGYGLVNAYKAISEINIGRGTITGRVLKDGHDEEYAQINHKPLNGHIFVGDEVIVKANINDNVSILEVDLLSRQISSQHWARIPMEKLNGDHKSGEYKAIIPRNFVDTPGFEYKIRVKDFGGNITETDIHEVKVIIGIVPDDYENDFEVYPNGWTLNGDWEWGIPVGDPVPHSGSKLIGTKIGGNYSNNTNSILITPPIDLRDTNLRDASLRFFQWYNIENNYDKGKIYVTTDLGQTWIQVKPEYTDINSNWHEVLINLKEYIGSEEQVFVSFQFTTDSSGVRRGWYIDNVRLVGAHREPPTTPSNLTTNLTATGGLIQWTPSPELDVEGYNVYRSEIIEGGTKTAYSLIGNTGTPRYLDSTVESGKNYSYKVLAYDFSGNHSDYSNEIELQVSYINILYFTDFENENHGFTKGAEPSKANSWEWGKPLSGPNTSYTGTKLWATILNGPYLDNNNSWIESPTITIPSEGNPVLCFDHWFETYSASLAPCYVYVKGDNGTWTNITPGSRYGGYTGKARMWNKEQISLNAYKGQNINIRFTFVSNVSINKRPGWYIDNVGVALLNNSVNLLGKEELSQVDYIANKFDEEIKDSNSKDTLLSTNVDSLYEEDNQVSALPVDAIVTVLETGRSSRTSLVDGKFSIRHPANEEGKSWTLRAESYGYYPQEIEIQVFDDETTKQDFFLQPIPTGSISGIVFDRLTEEIIKNATISINEDSLVLPVVSNIDGEFIISDIYQGNYTLRITARDFDTLEIPITIIGGENLEITIPLKRFIGFPGELIYDDGTVEEKIVLDDINTGVGVRVSPIQYGKLDGVNIFFWNTLFPNPGGNEIGIAVYEIDDNNSITRMIGSPKVVTIERGKWNYIDLSDIGFTSDVDFIISTYQIKVGKYSPATGLDTNYPNRYRSYVIVNNEAKLMPRKNGNLLMRAVMDYSLEVPEITNLDKVTYTNKDNINLEGYINEDCQINIYVNDIKYKEVTTNNKVFREIVELHEGENIIYVTANMNNRETEPSNSFTVIKDQVLPILNIITPEDETTTREETILVTGIAQDQYIHKVLINEKQALLDNEGYFQGKTLLNNGENIIAIEVHDLAGNITSVERVVFAVLDRPILTDLEPSEDVVLKFGDTLDVSFRSDAPGEGYFRVILPSLNSNTIESFKVPMEEVETGFFRGQWIIPEGVVFRNAVIEIEFTDTYGNKVFFTTPGKLTIIEKPMEYNMENLPSNSVIIGNEAFDINYLNTNTDAQIKLIEWSNVGKEVYIKLNSHTIVNSNGVLAGIDDLEDRITYYDSEGERTIYKK